LLPIIEILSFLSSLRMNECFFSLPFICLMQFFGGKHQNKHLSLKLISNFFINLKTLKVHWSNNNNGRSRYDFFLWNLQTMDYYILPLARVGVPKG
jgi:hypothetical protein